MSNTIEIPNEFKESIFPKFGEQEWYEISYSCHFSVNIVDRKLQIKEIERNNTCELKIDKGTLKGTNNGEWGGRLTFVPDDISKKEILIAGGNIIFIFLFKDKIYYIESFSHMTFNFGAMYELNKKGDKFIEKKVVDFIDAPHAFTIHNDKLLIATSKNFYIVKGYRKYLILKNTFWSGLYINSVTTINDENVFIGMSGGIAKLDLTTKSFKFYKNSKIDPNHLIFKVKEALSKLK